MTLTLVKARLSQRMAELITEADAIRADVRKKSRVVENYVRMTTETITEASYPEDRAKVWQYNFASFIAQMLDQTSLHWPAAESVIKAANLEYAIDKGRLLLIALKADLAGGWLDKITEQVQAEVATDYLGMATGLMSEGVQGKNEYVPAAVLAGAVLERGLRDLCGRQTPVVSTAKANGEPKTMNPLIDDLKAAKAFNELQAKELRAWADIRNAAAHGEFEKFNRGHVEAMVAGIGRFLTQYLGA